MPKKSVVRKAPPLPKAPDKRIVKRALKAAKELEKIPMPTRQEVSDIYKKALGESRDLQKLLKPEWFVKDVHGKPKKKAKKKRSRR